jgi:hypothetical protein
VKTNPDFAKQLNQLVRVEIHFPEACNIFVGHGAICINASGDIMVGNRVKEERLPDSESFGVELSEPPPSAKAAKGIIKP